MTRRAAKADREPVDPVEEERDAEVVSIDDARKKQTRDFAQRAYDVVREVTSRHAEDDE